MRIVLIIYISYVSDKTVFLCFFRYGFEYGFVFASVSFGIFFLTGHFLLLASLPRKAFCRVAQVISGQCPALGLCALSPYGQ